MLNPIDQKPRDFLSRIDPELGNRLVTLWNISQPIHDRQSRPNSNENGRIHVEMVEAYIWRLICETHNFDKFRPIELFLLSCCACCHDFDKGLEKSLPSEVIHGQKSGEFVVRYAESLILTPLEANAIDNIIKIHDLKNKDYKNALKNIPKNYANTGRPIDLHLLAILLKTADILHTDNSRVSKIAVKDANLQGFDKAKYLARECINGWYPDGSRIIIQANPTTTDQLSALPGCIESIKKKEWPAVEKELQSYGFPYQIEVENIGLSSLPEHTEIENVVTPTKTDTSISGKSYSDSSMGMLSQIDLEENISLAVISDLNIGRLARSADLQTEGIDDTAFNDNYLLSFLDFIDKENLKADYLVIPGNLTTTAKKSEIRLASKVISRIALELGVRHKNIFFVPGNHDVSWDSDNSKNNSDCDRFSHFYDDESIFERILKRGQNNLLDDQYFSIWSSNNILITAYNSSWNSNRTASFHRGLIHLDHLNAIKEKLKSIAIDEHMVKIFLIHHPPISHSTPLPTQPDHRGMVNADFLFRLLNEFSFDLLIHGNSQVPGCYTIGIDGNKPIVILSSGSFSSTLDTSLAGILSNQFHLIKLNKNDSIKGFFNSWAYSYIQGWMKSQSGINGIDFSEPFGEFRGMSSLSWQTGSHERQ